MYNTDLENNYQLKMTPDDFTRISLYIAKECGIKMPAVKKIMLESRLQKRLKALDIATFKEYADYVLHLDKNHEEVVQMIDAVTTNKTYFFREADHFNFISDHIAYELKRTRKRTCKIWSAGCSSGEEAYTLAIIFDELAENCALKYTVFATDICSEVLQKATKAIYSQSQLEHIPVHLKKKYFLRNKNINNSTIRLIPKIRSKVTFERLNFMDDHYEVNTLFDIIFCRNVLIYFEKETQESVIKKLCSRLNLGGLFFLGHSESITNMDVPLVQIKPTIYKKV